MIELLPRLPDIILNSFNLEMEVCNTRLIPRSTTLIVVSNHRSFMDALILLEVVNSRLRIACHHYLGQMPLIRELVTSIGCFPLEKPPRRARHFMKQATGFLKNRQSLGIFPEGAYPMVQLTPPNQVGEFESGFAHVAFQSRNPNLAILPVAIASEAESVHWTIPLQFLRLFDNSEPLFELSGLHPIVVYERVKVIIGSPYRLTLKDYQEYQGQKRKKLAKQLSDYCRQEIINMLKIS